MFESMDRRTDRRTDAGSSSILFACSGELIKGYTVSSYMYFKGGPVAILTTDLDHNRR